jgi:hypothetical protein
MLQCPGCETGFQSPSGAKVHRCGTCGIEINLAVLSLELPQAGAEPAGSSVPPPPRVETAPLESPSPEGRAPGIPSQKPKKPVPKPASSGTFQSGQTAWKVVLGRKAKLPLPAKCGCCLAESTDFLTVNLQGFPVGVPSCAACLRHPRRTKVRRFTQILAFAALWPAVFNLLHPGPFTLNPFLGIFAAITVAAYAVGYVLVPRYRADRAGQSHACEGPWAWIVKVEPASVTMAFCNKAYADLAAESDPEDAGRPRALRGGKKRLLGRWLSGVLFGSQREASRSLILRFVRPVLALGLMAGGVVVPRVQGRARPPPGQ